VPNRNYQWRGREYAADAGTELDFGSTTSGAYTEFAKRMISWLSGAYENCFNRN